MSFFPERGFWSLAAIAATLLSVSLQAAPRAEPSAAETRYFEQQTSTALALVSRTLQSTPPQIPPPAQRELALTLLDTVLHDPAAPQRAATRAFVAERLAATVHAIETTSVTHGAMIWKLYNHGFVVRTPTATLGFDLIRTPPYLRDEPTTAPDVIDRLAAQCDALFISHVHGDHADRAIGTAFLDAGKPVVAPPDVWPREPLHQRLTQLPREADRLQSLPIQHGARMLKLVVYPGHQQISTTDTVQNNVCLIFTPEMLSVCQTGDQSWMPDFAWIDAVARRHHLDILLPNCWTADLPRMVRGMRPHLVIPGHENELGHDVVGRIPFGSLYALQPQLESTLLPMAWGEAYHYQP